MSLLAQRVQGMANKEGDKMMSLLAQRVQSAMLTSADPFAKVKGMIQEMIEKLVAEAQKEASHKAFCDKEMSETKAKRDDKQGELDTLNAKIDKATSKIAKLKEDIATLQKELAEIAAAQQKADKMRAEEAFAQTTHDKATGAASGIIGMLEVVESDFSKNLAEGQAAEDAAIEAYEKLTQDNQIATTEKTTDQKETEAALIGLKEDKEGVTKELDAVLEYR